MNKRYSAFLKDAEKFRVRVRSLVGGGATQTSVSEKLGISRQRVNQIVHADRRLARRAIMKRVAERKMPPASKLKCVDCGSAAREYDHRDYSKPLLVDAVCRPCHTARTKADRQRIGVIIKRGVNGK